MYARKVLADCQTLLATAESAPDYPSFRIAWSSLLAMLRTVGVVLWAKDRMSCPAMNQAVVQRLATWKREPNRFPIFWHFIKCADAVAVSEYNSPSSGPPYEMNGDLVAMQFTYCLDVAREAISWRGSELDAIEAISSGEAGRMGSYEYRQTAKLARVEGTPR